MEEERANGLYWEEIRQTVAGLSAFPEHYRAEVPGGVQVRRWREKVARLWWLESS